MSALFFMADPKWINKNDSGRVPYKTTLFTMGPVHRLNMLEIQLPPVNLSFSPCITAMLSIMAEHLWLTVLDAYLLYSYNEKKFSFSARWNFKSATVPKAPLFTSHDLSKLKEEESCLGFIFGWSTSLGWCWYQSKQTSVFINEPKTWWSLEWKRRLFSWSFHLLCCCCTFV